MGLTVIFHQYLQHDDFDFYAVSLFDVLNLVR